MTDRKSHLTSEDVRRELYNRYSKTGPAAAPPTTPPRTIEDLTPYSVRRHEMPADGQAAIANLSRY